MEDDTNVGVADAAVAKGRIAPKGKHDTRGSKADGNGQSSKSTDFCRSVPLSDAGVGANHANFFHHGANIILPPRRFKLLSC
jgi:hypothetical protein